MIQQNRNYIKHIFYLYTVYEGDKFFSFRIMSYNILADTYADSDFSKDVLYPYCPQYALDMDYRKQLILKEIIGINQAYNS